MWLAAKLLKNLIVTPHSAVPQQSWKLVGNYRAPLAHGIANPTNTQHSSIQRGLSPLHVAFDLVPQPKKGQKKAAEAISIVANVTSPSLKDLNLNLMTEKARAPVLP